MDNCNNKTCGGMPRSELQNNLDHISQSIDDLKLYLNKINDHQEESHTKLITQEKDIEYLKKDIENLRKEQIRKDKKTMWYIGLIVPFVSAIISGLITFINMT